MSDGEQIKSERVPRADRVDYKALNSGGNEARYSFGTAHKKSETAMGGHSEDGKIGMATGGEKEDVRTIFSDLETDSGEETDEGRPRTVSDKADEIGRLREELERTKRVIYLKVRKR